MILDLLHSPIRPNEQTDSAEKTIVPFVQLFVNVGLRKTLDAVTLMHQVDSNLRFERPETAPYNADPFSVRGPRMHVSFSRRCRPGLVKKPSFPLEIRFPGVAMKFQTDCSGLLHNKYGSLFRQSRASQSQRGSQNNVAPCLLFKAAQSKKKSNFLRRDEATGTCN